MGWESQQLLVTGNVSRHNSDEDRDHDALWADLSARIQALVDEDRYTPIGAMVCWDTGAETD